MGEAERRLLRHLATFASSFTVEGAVAVTANASLSTVAEGIADLVSKSLVTLDNSGTSLRWRLLETVRIYALQKLRERGEAEQARRRHAEYLRDRFTGAADAHGSTPPVADIDPPVREIDDVRAALDWAFCPTGDAAIGVVLTAAYAQVWMRLSLMVECRERTDRAIDSLTPEIALSPRLRLQLYAVHGVTLLFTMGSAERAATVLATAIELAETLDDVEAQMRTLWSLWNVHLATGEARAAELVAKRFANVAARAGEQADLLVADRLMGQALLLGGKLREAHDRFERVQTSYVAPTSQRHTALYLNDQRVMARAQLAPVLMLRGFADQATAQARASLADAEAANNKLTLCWVLRIAVIPVASITGDLVAADRALAMLVDLASSMSSTFWIDATHWLQGKQLIARGEFAPGLALLRAALATYR